MNYAMIRYLIGWMLGVESVFLLLPALTAIVYQEPVVAAYLGTEAAAGAVFVAVLGLIWINFLLEILIDVLLAPALYRVVSAVERTLGRKKSGGASSAIEKAEKKKNPDEENAGTWDITE